MVTVKPVLWESVVRMAWTTGSALRSGVWMYIDFWANWIAASHALFCGEMRDSAERPIGGNGLRLTREIAWGVVSVMV